MVLCSPLAESSIQEWFSSVLQTHHVSCCWTKSFFPSALISFWSGSVPCFLCQQWILLTGRSLHWHLRTGWWQVVGMRVGHGERERSWWWKSGCQPCPSIRKQGGDRQDRLQVCPPGWTKAGERLVPRRTVLAASNASNERENCSQIGFFSGNWKKKPSEIWTGWNSCFVVWGFFLF